MLQSSSQPWLAGLIRGLLLAIVGAVIAFVTSLQIDDMPGYVYALVPAAIYALRQIEALILDQPAAQK